MFISDALLVRCFLGDQIECNNQAKGESVCVSHFSFRNACVISHPRVPVPGPFCGLLNDFTVTVRLEIY